MTDHSLLDNPNSPSTAPLMEKDLNASLEDFVWTITQAADDRKAEDIVVLKVTDVSYLADYFVIVSGFSRAQVRAIANSIEEKVAELHERKPRQSGQNDGSWILQDYGNVIVHIFMPQERSFYNLEAFWSHAERIQLADLDSARTLA